MKTDAILIKATDNVATALREIAPDEEITVGTGDKGLSIQIQALIPYGHKFAVIPIAQGEYIVKYGEVIGRAIRDIPVGTHAHVQNIESLRGRGDLEAGSH